MWKAARYRIGLCIVDGYLNGEIAMQHSCWACQFAISHLVFVCFEPKHSRLCLLADFGPTDTVFKSKWPTKWLVTALSLWSIQSTSWIESKVNQRCRERLSSRRCCWLHGGPL